MANLPYKPRSRNRPCRGGQANQKYAACAGVDRGGSNRRVCVPDRDGAQLGESAFARSGAGPGKLCAYILESAASTPDRAAVAIETPQGPVAEALQERGFAVRSINPRQPDRFRDRRSPAGSKDDRRDAWVPAGSLRTDPQAFRALHPPPPRTLELRGLERAAEEPTGDRVRLTNRLRARLRRYYPQILELTDDPSEDWIPDLRQAAPAPDGAGRLSRARIAGILRRNRIRRIDAAQVGEVLGREALSAAEGTAPAAAAGIALPIERLRPVKRQLKDVGRRVDGLLEGCDEESPDGAGQRDAEILRSIPGVGRTVPAALPSEARDPIRRRDCQALRAYSGAAPATKRSGKSIIAVRRRAASQRPVNALTFWAGAAIRHDPQSRLEYDALRARGKGHVRALRSAADRLLFAACAMLGEQTPYDPERRQGVRAAARA